MDIPPCPWHNWARCRCLAGPGWRCPRYRWDRKYGKESRKCRQGFSHLISPFHPGWDNPEALLLWSHHLATFSNAGQRVRQMAVIFFSGRRYALWGVLLVCSSEENGAYLFYKTFSLAKFADASFHKTKGGPFEWSILRMSMVTIVTCREERKMKEWTNKQTNERTNVKPLITLNWHPFTREKVKLL